MWYPSFKIGNKDTLHDWKLYTWKDWVLDSPETKTILVDIPLGDGTVDLTEALAGVPRYNDRMLSIPLLSDLDYYEFHALYDEIKGYCHGKKMEIVIPTEKDYYLIGTIDVSNYSWEGYGTITMEIYCEPFLYALDETYYSGTLSTGQSTTQQLTNNGSVSVIPKVKVDQISYVGTSIDNALRVAPGTYQFTSLLMLPGESKTAYIENRQLGNYIVGTGFSTPFGTNFWSGYTDSSRPNNPIDPSEWYGYRGRGIQPLQDGWVRVLLANNGYQVADADGNLTAGNELFRTANVADIVPFATPGTQYDYVFECRVWNTTMSNVKVYFHQNISAFVDSTTNSSFPTQLSPGWSGVGRTQGTVTMKTGYSDVAFGFYFDTSGNPVRKNEFLNCEIRLGIYPLGEAPTNWEPGSSNTLNWEIFYNEAKL